MLQEIVNELPCLLIEHGKGRHAKEHAPHAENPAEEDHRKDHPEGRNAKGIAQNLGVEHVSVKLLEHDDENGQRERIAVVDKDQKMTQGMPPLKGPKVGIMLATPHHHRNQHAFRDVQQLHEDKEQNADNHRVDKLPAHEAAEHAVDILEHAHHGVHHMGREGAQTASF